MQDKVIITGTTDDDTKEFSIFKTPDVEAFYLMWNDSSKATYALNKVEEALVKEIIKLQDGDGEYSLRMFARLKKGN